MFNDNQVSVGSGRHSFGLGVAMLEVGKAFSTRFGLRDLELFQFKINPLAFVPILLVSVILLLCALSCIGNWMPRFARRQYLPISRLNSVSATFVLNM